MRTLIFSDPHLNLPFDEKKFNFLKGIIEPVDQVVINGDFWEGQLIKFQQFVESPWRHLFPLLKQKNTIYIYGNHDEASLSDERVNLFSDKQIYRHELNVGDRILVIEHGDRLAHLKKRTKLYTRGVAQLERVLVHKLGNKAHKYIGGKLNRRIKRKLKTELLPQEIFVCGHTHYGEVDETNQFINTGFIRHGLGQYLVVDDKRLAINEEWYH